MANINSLMSSAASSTANLYGTRNVLSGLASGMDTESMIENSISGYKTKITQLEQQQTKYQWKQDAYRSITDKMYDLTQKYTSYTSKTNLYSNAFFNNSISTTAVGNADAVSKVSATGRSSSDIQILAAQAATAASYSVSASNLGLNVSNTVTQGLGAGANADITVGTLKGTMTLNYDGQKIDLDFDETDQIDGSLGNTLADAITKKLAEATINTGYGTKKASEVISVGTDANGQITFTETGTDKRGANPYISYMDSNLKNALGATDSKLYEGSSDKKYTFSTDGDFTATKTVADYLSGKDISVTVDGVTKTFRLDKNTIASDSIQAAFKKGLNDLGAGVTAATSGNELSFSVSNSTSNFSISVKDEKAAELLGLSKGVSNYLDSSKSTIGNLIGADRFTFPQAAEADDTVKSRLKADGDYYVDHDTGNRYQKLGDDYYRVNEKGDPLYELKINDKSIFISKDATLDSVLSGINNSDMGVNASFSKLTGKFVFTAKETGTNGNISFDNNLARKLFSASPLDRTLGDIYNVTDPTAEFGVRVKAKPVLDETGAQVQFNANSTVGDVLHAINSNTTANGVQSYIKYDAEAGKFYKSSRADATYDPATRTFTGGNWEEITGWNVGIYEDASNATGRLGRVDTATFFPSVIDPATRTQGQDAAVRALVNNELVTLQRSSNTIDLDGMKVTLNGNFNEGNINWDNGKVSDTQPAFDPNGTEKANGVSFSTSAGSDDLVKTITDFVNDYNAILKELHDAYATQPAEKNSKNHTKYDPLTDDDKSGMSEKAIESYEAKAKQGILFGDSDLRAAYESLTRAISPSGNDGAALRNMGIDVTYSGGLTQIKLDESKLRDALSKDPDSVRNAFTKSKDGGASTDGLMTSIKNIMEQYSSTSFSRPGILVKKAGSTYSSTSLLSNAMQTQIDNVQKQIEQWQTKMSSKIDYYTRQFTALEKLMNTMNSQSSALAGLMGG